MFVPIAATILAVGTDSIGAYRLALMPFYVIGIVYATSTAGDALQVAQAEEKAFSAGLLVVAVTFFLWIIVAGIDRLLASTGLSASGFAISKRQVGAMYGVQQMSTRSVSGQQAVTSVSVTATPQASAVGQAPSTAGTVTGIAGSANRPPTSESQMSDGKPKEADKSATTITGVHVDVAPDVVYEYKAQAMYSYTASVDDPNELSFAKGEVMEIVDNQGKWWQARKADGSIGIVPSNYMKLSQ